MIQRVVSFCWIVQEKDKGRTGANGGGGEGQEAEGEVLGEHLAVSAGGVA
jgi:hypothetical protein